MRHNNFIISGSNFISPQHVSHNFKSYFRRAPASARLYRVLSCKLKPHDTKIQQLGEGQKLKKIGITVWCMYFYYVKTERDL
jgi:hypothetical protein